MESDAMLQEMMEENVENSASPTLKITTPRRWFKCLSKCASKKVILPLLCVLLLVTALEMKMRVLNKMAGFVQAPITNASKLTDEPMYSLNITVQESPYWILNDEPGGNATSRIWGFPAYAPRPVFAARADLKMDLIAEFIQFPKLNASSWEPVYNEDAAKLALSSRMEQKIWSENKKLKIFILLHSHNDAGWLMTFEQYFQKKTKRILDNILQFLTEDPALKFIWAEVSFFSRWWKDLSEIKRQLVRRLLSRKQLEFVSGGWVMPDEAVVHYESYLLQLTEGHGFLKNQLNYTVKNGWAIDPFGHSPSIAFLQGQAGIKNTVINRVHYLVKHWLRERKSLEFYWRQPWESRGKGDVFCHLLPYSTYDSSQTCGPDADKCQLYKTKSLDIYGRARGIISQLQQKSLLFRTDNVLWPIGGDFRWSDFGEWASDLQSLKEVMGVINSRPEFFAEIKFATLDEYFEAVHSKLDNEFNKPYTLSGDFFPYASEGQDYWTGFYTSRVFHKSSERQLMASLRSTQLLLTLMTGEISKHWAKLDFEFIPHLVNRIVSARRTLSLFQHHDGITGTSANPVVVDYANKLRAALLDCQFVSQQSLYFLSNLKMFTLGTFNLTDVKGGDIYYDPVIRRNPNPTSLGTPTIVKVNKATTTRIVTIFNPLEFSRTQLFHVRVSNPNVQVLTLDGVVVPSEIYPVFKYSNDSNISTSGYLNITVNLSASDEQFELSFVANLKPLEIKHFKIVFNPVNLRSKGVNITVINAATTFTAKFKSLFESPVDSIKASKPMIQGANFTLNFSKNGLLRSVRFGNKSILSVAINFNYYTSAPGSGLYSFNPGRKSAKPIEFLKPLILVVEGRLKGYVEVSFPTVRHKLTLYNHEGLKQYALDVENTIDITRKTNYELVMRIKASISTGKEFYTDSNGFQMIQRVWRDDLPLQGNYYPMATSAYVADDDHRMTLLAAQAGGVTSPSEGELEIMQDRTTEWDDNHGILRGGADNSRTVSRYQILIEKPQGEFINRLVPFLSLEAQHHLHSFLNPLQGFILKLTKKKNESSFEKPSENRFETYTDITTSAQSSKVIPTSVFADYRISGDGPTACDTFLVGVQPFPEADEPLDVSNTGKQLSKVGLLYRRIGFDPTFNTSQISSHCSMLKATAGMVSVSRLFGNLFQNNMKATSLTFVHENGTASTEIYFLRQMAFQAFIAEYNNYYKI